MTPQDARLALERHATSKISSESDLWGVQTFGFRGEALPSIASVSRLTLQTRSAESDEGFRLRVEAGREVESRACGIPQGTQIEVEDLFFNTPARLKFQKTEATEAANVSETVLRLAIANPDVHFRLRSNGRVMMDLPPHRDLGERVRAGLHKRGSGALHEAVGHENGVAVHAFLAGPDCASTTSRNTFIFVGRRFVRDRSLLQALSMGYGALVEKGRYPMAVLFVDVAGEDVDVNVHPQKMEVRFAQPQPVYAAVRHVLQRELVRAPWTPSASASSYSLPPGSRFKASARMADVARSTFGGPTATAGNLDRTFQVPAAEQALGLGPVPTSSVSPFAPGTAGWLRSLRFVGTVANAYFVLEEPGAGIVLVDHRAEHTRMIFAKLRRGYEAGMLPSQRLLFAIPVQVDDVAMTTLLSGAADIARLGFEADAFGPNTILVRSVPELMEECDCKLLLADVLVHLEQPPTSGSNDRGNVLAVMAAAASVPADVVLNAQYVEGLLEQIAGPDLFSGQPPFGPVLARMPLTDIDRRFGRP